jgi:YidC/Oxa1 family membrane protein insertase
MEQRAFIAVVLMAAILIIYQTFLVPQHEQAPPPPTARQEGGKAQMTTPPGAVPAPAQPSPAVLPTPAVAQETRQPQRITRVSTPLYKASVSSEGGKFQEFTLNYRGEKPMVILGNLGPTGLVMGPVGSPTAQLVAMQPSTDTVAVETGQQDLVLVGTQDGLRVRQTLTFRADSYAVESRVRVENPTNAPRSVTVSLPWSTRQDWREEKAKEKFQGQHPTEVVWAIDGGVIR